jgi:hypothetical protein
LNWSCTNPKAPATVGALQAEVKARAGFRATTSVGILTNGKAESLIPSRRIPSVHRPIDPNRGSWAKLGARKPFHSTPDSA